MKTTKLNKPVRKLGASLQAGFSLVELLVVIAVIGIIAAIAIPNIAGITGGAERGKAQRNAQNIASVFSAARAAGATNVVTSVTDAITLVGSGAFTFPTGSAYTGTATFRVPNLSDEDQTAAAGFLTISGETTGDPVGSVSQLVYNSAGNTAPTGGGEDE